MTQPRAGWYPDPSDPSRQRYFNGTAWTESYAPFPAPQIGAGQPANAVPQKKFDKKYFLGVGAVVVILIAIASTEDKKPVETNTAASVPSTGSTIAPAKPAGPAVAAPGSSVRDGKFEFQVLGVDRSATKEGVMSPQHAKGEFFVVNIRVTNIGDKAQSFFASNQKLIIDGKKYDATTSLSDNTWMQDINPGLGTEGSVSFDIPPGAVPEAIEFHDSMFSGGARVAL
ncbi:DUF4352 domain-containing protein [Mycobacterium sp. HNNTM2301]|uniref:DUF4352 domain-containing protein n=1 Tax=Mycobacterium hainanense TaxID=3289775 RepID=UPI0035A6714F